MECTKIHHRKLLKVSKIRSVFFDKRTIITMVVEIFSLGTIYKIIDYINETIRLIQIFCTTII